MIELAALLAIPFIAAVVTGILLGRWITKKRSGWR
jgi:hypothetical protein